jgi:Fe2+ or Zn2+ uptake regulation protein
VKSDLTVAEGVLRTAGLRRTPVRVGVIQVLSRGGGRPMSVPQILGKLKDVDSVTVYRTLGTFARKGLVHRVRGEDRGWRYALGGGAEDHDAPQHRHPHFVCESCGRVECLAQAEIPRGFVQSLGVGDDYAVSYSEVVLHGVCPRCAG